MAITVNIDLGYEFAVNAKAADVFAVLSDVPTSVSHFPKVHKLTVVTRNLADFKQFGVSVLNPFATARK